MILNVNWNWQNNKRNQCLCCRKLLQDATGVAMNISSPGKRCGFCSPHRQRCSRRNACASLKKGLSWQPSCSTCSPSCQSSQHLWPICSSYPAQNKLQILPRQITQLCLRGPNVRRPKCSSQTCQVYLAEARPQSLPSLKSVSDRRVFWCFCVLFCVVLFLSLLLWKQILWWSKVVQCLIFPFGQAVFLWNRCCLLAVTACLGLGEGLSYVSKPLDCG